MRKVLIFAIFFLVLFIFPKAVLTQEATSSAIPVASPNSCNGTCGSDANCQSGLVCYQGYCRNPSCQSALDCSCPTVTPSSTPTKTPTPRPTVRATVKPSVTPTETPTPIPLATNAPVPTESAAPASGLGINLKGIAIGSLIVGFLAILGGLIYMKLKNKDRVPPIGTFGS